MNCRRFGGAAVVSRYPAELRSAGRQQSESFVVPKHVRLQADALRQHGDGWRRGRQRKPWSPLQVKEVPPRPPKGHLRRQPPDRNNHRQPSRSAAGLGQAVTETAEASPTMTPTAITELLTGRVLYRPISTWLCGDPVGARVSVQFAGAGLQQTRPSGCPDLGYRPTPWLRRAISRRRPLVQAVRR